MRQNLDAQRDRCLGALVGLAVGDALGTTLEFQPRPAEQVIFDMVGGGPFQLPPGGWTDDTSMALALADSLLEFPHLNAIDCTKRWLSWRDNGAYSHTGTCFDIGAQTSAALTFWDTYQKPVPVSDRAGNGGIMRLAPAVIRHWSDYSSSTVVAMDQSDLTHNNAECRKCALDLAGALQEAIALGVGKVLDRVPECVKSRKRYEVKSSGYVRDTLEAALWCLSWGDGFKNTVLRAVNLGDDADTVRAVTGQLAGAAYGLSGIPPEWVSKLLWSSKIIEMAERLFEASV